VAPADALRRYLATAPPAYLEGAVGNPELGIVEMLLLLRNRGCPARLLEAIGRDPGWMRSHRVKSALVLHPRTPLLLGRNLVHQLFWKDLLNVSAAPHVSPVLRRQAETYLRDRIESMALGERIALARRAGRGLIGVLCRAVESPVLRALLGNPILVEADAIRVASNPGAPPDLLAHLARHPKWGRRRGVLLALGRNRRTPIPTALGILRESGVNDLRRLCRDPGLPAIVRVAAERKLARGASQERPAARTPRGSA
jgi:hypothetical protein